MIPDDGIGWGVRDLGNGEFEVTLGLCLGERHCTPDRAATLGWGWGSIKRAAKRAYRKTKKLAVKAVSGSMAKALFKAATTASELANNPVLAAMLPPGTPKALAGAIKLANAAKRGNLSQALKRFKGPGARRLAKALSKYDKGCRR